MTRVVFMGTPDFAVPSLEALVADPAYEIVGVVTQPDRPAGRGQSLRQSAVKVAALKHDLPIFQPETLRTDEAVARLAEWKPDLMVVAAFGQILRRPVLDLPAHGCVNVHASLLPRWRGAAPIQYAIRAGDEKTGVTIMLMDVGLDSGPMLASIDTPITTEDTGQTVHDRLAILGAELLIPTLNDYLSGEIVPYPQPEEGITLCPTLRKVQGQIDWRESAQSIDWHVRGFTPWPGTFTYLDGKLVKIISGKPQPDQEANAKPGTLVEQEGQLAIATGEGIYQVDTLQPAGKKRMPAAAFMAGRREVIGQRFELPETT